MYDKRRAPEHHKNYYLLQEEGKLHTANHHQQELCGEGLRHCLGSEERCKETIFGWFSESITSLLNLGVCTFSIQKKTVVSQV